MNIKICFLGNLEKCYQFNYAEFAQRVVMANATSWHLVKCILFFFFFFFFFFFQGPIVKCYKRVDVMLLTT